MAQTIAFLDPGETTSRFHYVHIFHLVRSKFGVVAASHGDAIAAALPAYESLDFSYRQADGIEGYLETLPTDRIASILVDENPNALADQAAFQPDPPDLDPAQAQVLQLASALHQIASEDQTGHFARIARQALAVSGITILGEHL